MPILDQKFFKEFKQNYKSSLLSYHEPYKFSKCVKYFLNTG